MSVEQYLDHAARLWARIYASHVEGAPRSNVKEYQAIHEVACEHADAALEAFKHRFCPWEGGT